MKKQKVSSIASVKRLEDLLEEVETELGSVQPKIEKLERELEKLRDLKNTKQKLITLKLSIKSILENFSLKSDTQGDTHVVENMLSDCKVFRKTEQSLSTSRKLYFEGKIFLPDQAFEEVNEILRQKNSLNYEIYRAIVFNGGRATTEQIKSYLVENHIHLPSTGQGFEDVELTDISSRVNYLVRKNIVEAAGKGLFISRLGWADEFNL